MMLAVCARMRIWWQSTVQTPQFGGPDEVMNQFTDLSRDARGTPLADIGFEGNSSVGYAACLAIS